jgi:hypothetical protein
MALTINNISDNMQYNTESIELFTAANIRRLIFYRHNCTNLTLWSGFKINVWPS